MAGAPHRMKTEIIIASLIVAIASIVLFIQNRETVCKFAYKNLSSLHDIETGGNEDHILENLYMNVEEGNTEYVSHEDMTGLLIYSRNLDAKQLISVIHKVNSYENHFPLDDMLSVLDHGVETIRSTVIPLTLEQAKEICRCFNNYNCYSRSGMIIQLARNITKTIKEQYSGEAFVKITTASGKDAQDEKSPKFKKYWDEYIDSPQHELMKKRNETWEMNYRVCALTDVHQKILKVNDGFEAMEQLVISKKIIYHLTAAITFPQTFRKSIIIREWIDMSAEEEFRGWVVDKKLVAVSQFSYFCYNENLVKYQKKIEKAIVDFYNYTVAPKFAKLPNAPSTFMIDFVVKNWESDSPKVMVLEVGGISVYTGLFDYYGKDSDFFQGKKPYELRVLHQMNILKNLHLNIKEWIPFIVGDLDLEALKSKKKNLPKQDNSSAGQNI